MADVEVSGHGSIFLLTPLSSAAREWIDVNVQEDARFFGNALAVEARFVSGLAEGMAEDGLVVV